jgi:hypothetical protein
VAESDAKRRASHDVPQKSSQNGAAPSYSYGAYLSGQYPHQDQLLNYHPLYHSPVINNKGPVDRYSNFYYGSRLADMSQVTSRVTRDASTDISSTYFSHFNF